MAQEREYQALLDRIAALRGTVAAQNAANILANPQLADALLDQINDLYNSAVKADEAKPAPPDRGLAELAGVGPGAAREFGDTRIPNGVVEYDDTVTSERIVAVGDLYYIYQHEKIGVFRVVRKLQELFRAGAVRLSGGQGAFKLYQFDRREVLRYTQQDRLQAYRRIFGYGSTALSAGARPNSDFHNMFTHFVHQVTLFWRDKRISDVIRERAYDPSFGSIAIVRRAGLDLRNNLKWTSFGHLSVLRVEVMQLLEEAFKILESDDVKRLFGADSAWDVVEEVLIRYFNERLVTSPRQRMGVAGREVFRWLGNNHVLNNTRPEFEGLLLEIAEFSEEWLTSAQALGLAGRTGDARVVPVESRWRAQSPIAPRTNARVPRV